MVSVVSFYEYKMGEEFMPIQVISDAACCAKYIFEISEIAAKKTNNEYQSSRRYKRFNDAYPTT